MKKVFLMIGWLIALLMGVTSVLLLSGSAFMYFYHLPLNELRPWSIIQYWQLYGQSSNKSLRIAVNLCLWLPWVGVLLAMFKLAEKKPKSLHGDARFATLSEIRASGLINPKEGLDRTILVGKYKNEWLTYAGSQFVALAAPTRSGKGVGIVVPNCLNFSESLVVLDIKGENFDITSGFRAACGHDVFLFAPFDADEVTHRYNPLEYISDDPFQRISDIDSIATALYAGDNQNDKFWSEQAKDLFRGLCLFVLETPDLPKTLGEILRQASGKGMPMKKYIMSELEKAQETRPYSNACVDSLNRILQNSDNTLAGIVSTFNTPLLAFQNPRVDLATSANDFDLREVRKKPMSIYFKISPDKLEESSSKILVKLFFNQLLNLNTRVLPAQDPSLKYQCLVLMDEATSIGCVPIIQQSVSYMAGYNMRLLTVIQNKSQLEQAYGKAGAVTILSNHALMIMYTPSPTVMSDASEYSEMLGYETVKAKSTSEGRGSKSQNTSDQRRALMLPQELLEMPKDKAIVRLEHTRPIYCERIRYYLEPLLAKRANWQCPAIPKQDVNLFIAQTNKQVRVVLDEDLKDPDLAQKLVGLSALPSLPDELPEERYSEFIDEIFEGVVGNVLKQIPINTSKIKGNKNADLSKLAPSEEDIEALDLTLDELDDFESEEDEPEQDSLVAEAASEKGRSVSSVYERLRNSRSNRSKLSAVNHS